MISQREVGTDTHSFHDALRHVLRQDPDVIMLGEIRDRPSMETVLKAADTGHLVLLDAAHDRRAADHRPHHLLLPARTSTRRSARCWPARSARSSPAPHPACRPAGARARAEVLVNTAAIAELIRSGDDRSPSPT
jgi:twitching motility protein PilT